jgi:hypothetical protein
MVALKEGKGILGNVGVYLFLVIEVVCLDFDLNLEMRG